MALSAESIGGQEENWDSLDWWETWNPQYTEVAGFRVYASYIEAGCYLYLPTVQGMSGGDRQPLSETWH